MFYREQLDEFYEVIVKNYITQFTLVFFAALKIIRITSLIQT